MKTILIIDDEEKHRSPLARIIRSEGYDVYEANGGTLFLDEIGEMPLELQSKLLRLLETSEYLKIGDTKPSRSNFRLIAATNRDLKTESEEQRFRSDLYFRLNVFQIELPALRNRVKDILPLAQHFVEQFSAKSNRKTLKMSAIVVEKLNMYAWPGNIREFKNSLERAVILADGHLLMIETLPPEIQLLHEQKEHCPPFQWQV